MYRYTFNPPEDELVSYYLNNKITGKDDGLEADRQINEVNICHYEPMDLPGLAKIESSHTWYFISPVETFGKLNRRKRASRTGHWKITGNSCTIKDVHGNPIGLKKFLVFKENKRSSYSPSSSTTPINQHKSTWIIHEFHSFLHHPNKDNFVLCKLMRKTRSARQSGAVEDPSLEVIDQSPTLAIPDSILSHSQEKVVADDGNDEYCNELEDFLPEFRSTNSIWLDQSYDHFEHFCGGSFVDTTQSWGECEINGLHTEEIGQVYGDNIIDNSNICSVPVPQTSETVP